MTRKTLLPALIAALFYLSCTSPAVKEPAAERPTSPAYNCAALASKDTLYAIGNRILEAGGHEQIWNLSELDTSNYFTAEDYFVSPGRKDRLVWIEGQAGGSAGTASNLLMLLSCTDSLRILAAEQVGVFGLQDIKDLDGDGIKDIVSESGYMWMGECGDSYGIFNYKGGIRRQLYQANSRSILDCGKDNIGEFVHEGDTVEVKLDARLVQQEGGRYRVQQVRTVKIHNGGATDEAIKQNLLVKADTALVELTTLNPND